MNGANGLARQALKLSQTQDVVWISHINQMVRNPPLLLKGRFGSTDIHSLVEKPRIR
jgi:hypothetical protein